MYLPYALAPCGHSACYGCLVNWFKAPQNGEPAADQIPAYLRKKTCPHCRAIVKERPTEVWNIKDMVDSLVKSKFVPPHPDPPVVANRTADFDAWAGIFRKAWVVPPVADLLYPHPHYHHHPLAPVPAPAPAPVPAEGGARGGNNNAPPHAPPLQLMGMLDEEDGGIYRCIDCYHEIWGGVCSHCRRVYPGHDGSDEDDDGGSDVVWNDFADGSELDDEDEAFVHNHLGAWPAPGNPYRVGHWLTRYLGPVDPLDHNDVQSDNAEDDGSFHDYGLPDPQLMGEDGGDEEEAEDNESYDGSFIDDGQVDDEDRDYHGLMEVTYPDGFAPTRIIAPGPRPVGPPSRLTRIWEDEDDEADEEALYGAGPSRASAGVRGRAGRGIVLTDEEDQATERGDDEDEDLAEQVAAEES